LVEFQNFEKRGFIRYLSCVGGKARYKQGTWSECDSESIKKVAINTTDFNTTST